MAINKGPKPEYTDAMRCGHCGNFAPMIKGSVYSTVQPWADADGDAVEEGDIFVLLQCPSCQQVTLTHYYYHEYQDEEQAPAPAVLYPVNERIPVGLPPIIQKAYEASHKVKNVDANAFAVLVGRVLELVCDDRKAVGHSLNDKLKDLATKHEIPEKLVDVANSLRILRNVGAHAMLGELTDDEIPILGALTNALLEYVYTAPHLAQLAQERVNKLKKSSKKK